MELQPKTSHDLSVLIIGKPLVIRISRSAVLFVNGTAGLWANFR
jgi:hypothetical protein